MVCPRTYHNYINPNKPQYCPYTPNPIAYGKDNQATTPGDTSPLLDATGKRRIQQIVGSFLYYARAVDPTILIALSAIAAQQSAPTEEKLARVNQFLDYMWTHPDAKIRYRASDMILNLHSDASYLSAPKARSRAGGYFFLGSIPRDAEPIIINGAIHITCTILKLVAASAAEAELMHCFSMHKKLKSYALSSKNSDTHSFLPQYMLTISLLLESLTTPSNDNGREQWKCATSGYSTAKFKNSSVSTTNLVKRT